MYVLQLALGLRDGVVLAADYRISGAALSVTLLTSVGTAVDAGAVLATVDGAEYVALTLRAAYNCSSGSPVYSSDPLCPALFNDEVMAEWVTRVPDYGFSEPCVCLLIAQDEYPWPATLPDFGPNNLACVRGRDITNVSFPYGNDNNNNNNSTNNSTDFGEQPVNLTQVCTMGSFDDLDLNNSSFPVPWDVINSTSPFAGSDAGLLGNAPFNPFELGVHLLSTVDNFTLAAVADGIVIMTQPTGPGQYLLQLALGQRADGFLVVAEYRLYGTNQTIELTATAGQAVSSGASLAIVSGAQYLTLVLRTTYDCGTFNVSFSGPLCPAIFGDALMSQWVTLIPQYPFFPLNCTCLGVAEHELPWLNVELPVFANTSRNLNCIFGQSVANVTVPEFEEFPNSNNTFNNNTNNGSDTGCQCPGMECCLQGPGHMCPSPPSVWRTMANISTDPADVFLVDFEVVSLVHPFLGGLGPDGCPLSNRKWLQVDLTSMPALTTTSTVTTTAATSTTTTTTTPTTTAFSELNHAYLVPVRAPFSGVVTYSNFSYEFGTQYGNNLRWTVRWVFSKSELHNGIESGFEMEVSFTAKPYGDRYPHHAWPDLLNATDPAAANTLLADGDIIGYALLDTPEPSLSLYLRRQCGSNEPLSPSLFNATINTQMAAFMRPELGSEYRCVGMEVLGVENPFDDQGNTTCLNMAGDMSDARPEGYLCAGVPTHDRNCQNKCYCTANPGACLQLPLLSELNCTDGFLVDDADLAKYVSRATVYLGSDMPTSVPAGSGLRQQHLGAHIYFNTTMFADHDFTNVSSYPSIRAPMDGFIYQLTPDKPLNEHFGYQILFAFARDDATGDVMTMQYSCEPFTDPRLDPALSQPFADFFGNDYSGWFVVADGEPVVQGQRLGYMFVPFNSTVPGGVPFTHIHYHVQGGAGTSRKSPAIFLDLVMAKVPLAIGNESGPFECVGYNVTGGDNMWSDQYEECNRCGGRIP